MVANTKKAITPNSPRRAESLEPVRQVTLHLEALTKRRDRLREQVRSHDSDGHRVQQTDQQRRMASMTSALLSDAEANPQPLQMATISLAEEVRACDTAIERVGHRHLQVLQEAASVLWLDDGWAAADLETRKRQFALLNELAKLENERRQRLERARQQGALPALLISDMPWLNFSVSAKLPRGLTDLALRVQDFERNNANLKT